MKLVVKLRAMRLLGLCLAIASAACTAPAQELALSSNLLDYLSMGTLNIAAEYGVARHWTLGATAKYNPFSYSVGEGIAQSKQRSLQFGVRFWPWHIYSGWWLSAYARYQEYNTAGLSSPLSFEGDRLGASAGAGYSYMLSPHLNLDLGLSFWAGYDTYTSYSCPSCGNIVDQGQKLFFLPSEFLLSLSYIF